MSTSSIQLNSKTDVLLLELIEEEYTATLRPIGEANPHIPDISHVPTHLADIPVYVIDSTSSGTGRKSGKDDVHASLLRPALEFLHVDYRYIKTTSCTTIGELAASFAAQDATIVFISGDTSITEFVNALPLTCHGKLTMFPIPAGTGNSLALSLGHATVFDSIRVLLLSQNKPIPLNLYRARFPKGTHTTISNCTGKTLDLIFLVVLSWGFHASLVADSDTPEMRQLGLDRFQIAARQNLQRDQRYFGKTVINNDKIAGPYAYWLVTLAQRFEPTFEILPHGSIASNNLFLVSFNSQQDDDNKNGQYIMDIMAQVYKSGSHISNPKVTYREISGTDIVQLHIGPGLTELSNRFCLDGNIVTVPCVEHAQTIHVAAIGNTHRSWEFYTVI